MPKLTNLSIPSESSHTQSYSNFLGVDFSNNIMQVDSAHSPHAPNLISDLNGMPEKRVGWRVLKTLTGKKINGIFYYNDGETECYIVHAGTVMYRWSGGTDAPIELKTGVANSKSTAKYFKGSLIILTGTEMLVFDGISFVSLDEKAYIPTTTINRVPGATLGGVAYQKVNLLTKKRKNSFTVEPAGSITLYCDTSADDTDVYLRFTNKPNDYIFKWGAGETSGTKGNNYAGSVLAVASYATLTRDSSGVCEIVITLHMNDQNFPYISGADNLFVEFSHTPITLEMKKESFSITNSSGTKTVYIENEDSLHESETIIRFIDKGEQRFLTFPANSGNASQKGYNYFGSMANSTAQREKDANNKYKKISIDITSEDDNFPYTPGVDNISIEYRYKKQGYLDYINKCTFCEVYENRVFFSGNPDYPNTDWYSGVNDPLYVPDLNYTEIGTENSKIMGYLKTGDSLAIIKEDGAQDATIFMRTSTYDENGEMIFPVPKQNKSGIGAVSKHAITEFLDDPIFVSNNGVYGIGKQDITAERTLEMRSTRVNTKLRQQTLTNAMLAVWNNYLMLCVDDVAYVANSQQITYGNEYEWYYWTNIPAVCFCSNGDALYFGTSDGKLCKFSNDILDDNENIAMSAFNDNGEAITAEWTTKLDDDGDFMVYKTLPKKGAGVLFKSNTKSGVKISIRTEKDIYDNVKETSFGTFTFDDIDFENFTFNTSPYAIVPINTKVKKYKAIQIICKNDTINQAFGIYKIVRRFTVGNYVK